MNSTEYQFLIIFLESILINQSDSSCNDLILPASPITLDFMKIFNSTVDKSLQLSLIDNEIIGLDLEVTKYFINKLKENFS